MKSTTGIWRKIEVFRKLHQPLSFYALRARLSACFFSSVFFITQNERITQLMPRQNPAITSVAKCILSITLLRPMRSEKNNNSTAVAHLYTSLRLLLKTRYASTLQNMKEQRACPLGKLKVFKDRRSGKSGRTRL